MDADAEAAVVRLRALPAERARLDADELRALSTLRTAGCSWEEIADLAGFGSRQAVQQRYDRLGGL